MGAVGPTGNQQRVVYLLAMNVKLAEADLAQEHTCRHASRKVWLLHAHI